ncbi:MAG: PilT/PilU family type 4a pilus ATPase [Pyrinomonadaceae bacterium]
MEQLNKFLNDLVSKNAEALCLEPNKSPYVTTSSGNINVSENPLMGAQINSMVFELIPADVKLQLPNQDEVKFTHPHMLGKFNFSVKKSPSGFNVVVSLASANTGGTPQLETPANIPSPNTPELAAPQEQVPDNDTGSSAPKIPGPVSALDALAREYEIERANAKQEAAALNKKEEPRESVVEYVDVEPVIDQPEVLSGVEPTAGGSASDELSAAPDPAGAEPQAERGPIPIITQSAVSPEPVRHAVPAPQSQSFEAPASVTANGQPQQKMDELFRKMADIGASDLHMSVSMPPMVRRDGKMALLGEGYPELTAESVKTLLTSIMPKKNVEEFAEVHDTDFAYEIEGLARFRANIFMDRKGMGGVFRIIPSDILTAETLGLSKHILDLCKLSKGLVVVTGPTGSGKSTTLCAMVDYINRDREDHIITIEDPIEFVHENKKCLVNQREVHNHTDSFKGALRAALREDPDILLVGEMRDLETISIAIETAETGHLVFGTLHTSTAPSTVDRIIDQFPADRQQQIRVMLSESLRGVIAQTLLPKVGGGRIAALEVLLVTPAISNLIREGKTFQIPSAMQTGKNKGMVMLNDAMIDLCKKGIVEPKDAYIKAVDKTGFEMLLERNGLRI